MRSLVPRPGAQSPFIIGLLGLVVFFAVFLLAASLLVDGSGTRAEQIADGRLVSIGKSWPGTLDGCVTDVSRPVLPNCYREPVDRDSIIKQPFSSGSALAYSLVGLAILWLSARRHSEGSARVAFEAPYREWMGAVVVAMGPGAILFHGTLTAWGGWFDLMSMYGLLAFVVAYDLTRLRGVGVSFFSVFFGLFITLAGAVAAASGDARLVSFIAIAVGIAVFELLVCFVLLKDSGLRRDGRLLGVALLILGVSLVPWSASTPGVGGPTSVPYHLVWHLMSALFIVAYYRYLRSEARSPRGSVPA